MATPQALQLGLALGFALGATSATLLAVIVHHRSRRHWAALLRRSRSQLRDALGQATPRTAPQPPQRPLRAYGASLWVETAELPPVAPTALLAAIG